MKNGQIISHLTRVTLPFEVKNFRGPEMNAKARVECFSCVNCFHVLILCCLFAGLFFVLFFAGLPALFAIHSFMFECLVLLLEARRLTFQLCV